MNQTIFADSLIDPEKNAEERDLIVPQLMVLAQADKHNHGPVTTHQMYLALTSIFELSKEDSEVIRRDNVTRFKRTLQNTISHDLLRREKLAIREGDGWVITPKGKAYLVDNLLEPREIDHSKMTVLTDGERLTENIVAMHALVRLAELQKEDNKEPINTTQLRKDIKSSLPLSVSDVARLAGRKDTNIDKTVHNLTSHNTLTKNGWATRNEKGFVITDKGKALVCDILMESIPSPDFGFLLKEDQEYRKQINARRAEVALEAAAKRKAKQKPKVK